MKKSKEKATNHVYTREEVKAVVLFLAQACSWRIDLSAALLAVQAALGTEAALDEGEDVGDFAIFWLLNELGEEIMAEWFEHPNDDPEAGPAAKALWAALDDLWYSAEALFVPPSARIARRE